MVSDLLPVAASYLLPRLPILAWGFPADALGAGQTQPGGVCGGGESRPVGAHLWPWERRACFFLPRDRLSWDKVTQLLGRQSPGTEQAVALGLGQLDNCHSFPAFRLMALPPTLPSVRAQGDALLPLPSSRSTTAVLQKADKMEHQGGGNSYGLHMLVVSQVHRLQFAHICRWATYTKQGPLGIFTWWSWGSRRPRWAWCTRTTRGPGKPHCILPWGSWLPFSSFHAWWSRGSSEARFWWPLEKKNHFIIV